MCCEYGACPLMGEVGPRVTASSLVNEEGPEVPRCRALQVLELMSAHWCAGLYPGSSDGQGHVPG